MGKKSMKSNSLFTGPENNTYYDQFELNHTMTDPYVNNNRMRRQRGVSILAPVGIIIGFIIAGFVYGIF